MSGPPSLPILMPNVPEQRWSCHGCGNCCRTLVGNLTEAERVCIDEQGWAETLDVAPYVRVGPGWALNKHDDGACVFLDPDNRCRIHAEFGEAFKPLACRMFPFSVREHEHGWQASLRFDCPSVIESKGEPLSHHRHWISEAVREIPRRQDRRAEAELSRGLVATQAEIEAVTSRFSRLLRGNCQSLTDRLVAIARATTMLQEARYEKIRDQRFGELLDVLLATVGADAHDPPNSPTGRQRGMLRQLAFAHAEHVSLHLRRGRYISRLLRRWRQLNDARSFRRGAGMVPVLPGFEAGATYACVEAVRPADTDAEAVEHLVYRYLRTRFSSRSVFGLGYYGWPMFSGITAVWLSLGVAGWLARYHAAGAGRTTLTADDVGVAIGVVDRAASRVPALGTFAERARVAYLIRDDGVARLLRAYGLTNAEHRKRTTGEDDR